MKNFIKARKNLEETLSNVDIGYYMAHVFLPEDDGDDEYFPSFKRASWPVKYLLSGLSIAMNVVRLIIVPLLQITLYVIGAAAIGLGVVAMRSVEAVANGVSSLFNAAKGLFNKMTGREPTDENSFEDENLLLKSHYEDPMDQFESNDDVPLFLGVKRVGGSLPLWKNRTESFLNDPTIKERKSLSPSNRKS